MPPTGRRSHPANPGRHDTTARAPSTAARQMAVVASNTDATVKMVREKSRAASAQQFIDKLAESQRVTAARKAASTPRQRSREAAVAKNRKPG